MNTLQQEPEKIFLLNDRYNAFLYFISIFCCITLVLIPLALWAWYIKEKAQIRIYSDRMEYVWDTTTVYFWKDIVSITPTHFSHRGILGYLFNSYLVYNYPLLLITTKGNTQPPSRGIGDIVADWLSNKPRSSTQPLQFHFGIRLFQNPADILAIVEKRSGVSVSFPSVNVVIKK